MAEIFTGKRALVTGAGRGIGRAIVIALVEKGAHVIALSRTKKHLDTLKVEVPGIETVTVDVTNWKETESAVRELGAIDLLVNNAGVISLQEVGSITEEELDSCFAVNVKAVVNISQIVAQDMKERGTGGSIVNISSQAAIIGLPRHATYCASKGALDQITKVMAIELGPFQIRVNSVNPTVVLTDMGKAAVRSYASYILLETGSKVWLSDWSSEKIHNGTQNAAATTWRLSIYGVLGISQGLAVVLGSIFLVYGTRKASERYHNKMLDSVMKSPMSFFDSTPMGRIMNRFSSDMDVMDIQIYPVVDGWLPCLFGTCASFVVIGINTPMFLIPLVPIGITYFLLQRLHLNTFRQTMRLETTSRSPIYSHFLESIQGVSSICAYKVEEDFTKGFEEKLNKHMLCSFSTASCNRWLHFWLDFLGSIIVLIATILAIQHRYELGPATVALVITYALSVTDSLMWFVRMNTELEDKSISIERIDEYSKLKSEAPWSLPYDDDQHDWPQNGNIVFDGYSTRYTENLDLVLKEISLSIEANEKVGIVGRTGAGKSSITMALFRIMEPVDGTITIDNVDIMKVGLHCLRSKLTIIPQDPVLFTGTLRMNLDPKNEYPDDEIWDSLEKAHLKSFLKKLKEGLEYELEEGGTNFSTGQRQLICLARALLKRTKVLVLDEATASVDMDTDCLIQNTIRTAFKNHTIITIAHRLNTIIDYDKIVVMENGGIVEIGNPKDLLKSTESKFYQMSRDAGLV